VEHAALRKAVQPPAWRVMAVDAPWYPERKEPVTKV
jgi:hypothetical protein